MIKYKELVKGHMYILVKDDMVNIHILAKYHIYIMVKYHIYILVKDQVNSKDKMFW